MSFTDIGVLPTENSSALVAVSADGSVAAGAVSSPEGAMIWTASGGIHLLDGIGTNTVAYGISGDGSTIVGGDFSNSASIQAIAWSRQGGRQSLGNFIASSASPDGKVIV